MKKLFDRRHIENAASVCCGVAQRACAPNGRLAARPAPKATRRLAALALLLPLAVAGCADGIDDVDDINDNGTIGKDVDDNSGNKNGNSGSESDNNNNPGGNGNSGESAKCQESLKRCNTDGDVEVCKNGVYVTQACSGVCSKGECAPYNANSCSNPAQLAAGETQTVNTNTQGNYQVSNAYAGCNRIHHQLAVAKLNIDEFGYYQIDVKSKQSAPSWGVFESLTCAADAFYQNSCFSTDKLQSRKMTRLLSPGELFIFIGGLTGKNDPPAFDAEISLKRADSSDIIACGNIDAADANRKITVGSVNAVDVSQGTLNFLGKTSSGKSLVAGISSSKCDSAGNEIIYAFRLAEEKTVDASLTVTREDGSECGNTIEDRCPTAAMHIQNCADESKIGNRANTRACVQIDPAQNKTLSLSEKLPAGEYLLFVDSNSISLSYAYTLELSFR